MECNWRVESKGLEIKIFGWNTWLGGHSIYQDERQRKEEKRVNGTQKSTAPPQVT